MSSENPNSLLGDIATVALSKLKTYPGNPRRGDVDAIAESLLKNKQFDRPLVQKSTGYILAGNHTFMAARKIKWKLIDVEYLDVDDEAAKRIVIAANRIGDLGGYDRDALADLLTSLPDPIGTGYTDEDFNRMIAMTQEVADESIGSTLSILHRAQVDELAEDAGKEEVDDWAAKAFNAKRAHAEDSSPDAFLDASEELPGVAQLAEEPKFPMVTDWQIPALRQDMMIETLPANVQTWAGFVTRGETDPSITWLFNFGSETTKGMLDPSKMLLSFYAWDEHFETWWWNTASNVTKALNSGVSMAITPNFSADLDSYTLSLYNFYRSRYVGRYMQEVGIRVMPDLEVAKEARFYKFMHDTLPAVVPWASIQVQNIKDISIKKGKEREVSDDDITIYKEHVRKMVDAAHPENLLVYGNQQGFDLIDSMKLPCKTQFVVTRLQRISEYQSNMRKLAGPSGPPKL